MGDVTGTGTIDEATGQPDVAALVANLEVVQLRVDEIDPNPWNPNEQTEAVARALRESIERFGFVQPVIVRPNPDVEGRWQLIGGEHRWREAGRLGYELIPGVVIHVDDAEAKKLTIVLNEVSGDPDVVRLGQLLAELATTDDFRVALPYSEVDLQHLLEIGAQDWDDFQAGIDDGGDPPDPEPTTEVVLSLTPDKHAEFTEYVQLLRGHYDLAGSGVTEVVFEAVRQAAAAV